VVHFSRAEAGQFSRAVKAELRTHYRDRRVELLSEAAAAGNPRLAAVSALEQAWAIRG